MHGEISIRSLNANSTFIEGAAFSNSLAPQVQVFNAGIPGVESNIVTYGSAGGNGDIQGAAALNPKLALINFGINDINDGTETVAQTVQHISQMVTEMRAAGSDVIVIIPQPFDSPNYAADLPALRTALEAYATAANVPIIDLSATYGDSAAALNAAGLLTDNLHPDATLYADIGSGIASLLAQAVTGHTTTPPAANPPTVSVTSQVLTHDTGVSATDNITNDGQVTLTGTVSGGTGTTVQIDDGSTNLGAATVNSSGAWSFTTTLAAGTHTLTAVATDPTTSLTATSAAEPVITVETAAPTVTIGAPVEVATSAAVTLSGTVSGAAGTTVEVYNGSTDLGAATVSNTGAWSYTTATLPAGTYAFKAVATDLAGNTGAASDPTFTLAPTPPTVSVTSQVLAQDTGASATDHITSDGQVTLAGTVTGGAGTTVQIDDGSTKLGSATVNSSGVWSFTTTLAAGTHTLTAVATDPNTGLSATSAAEPVITVETTPPVVTIAAPVEAANATTVALSGTVSGAAGTTVEVYNGSTALGAATVTNGAWSYTTSALPAGAYAFKAVATDLAGNTGSATDPTFTVAGHSGGSDTLVLNLSETPVNGQDAQFTVSVDGHQVTGVETLTALRSADQSQNVTVTGDFGAGPHTVTLNFVNGFAGNPSDANRAIYVNAITLDNQTTFENVGDLYRGPVNFNTQIPATPPASNAGSQDSLVLNLSETPISGANVQFMVSVDGQIVGGVQTVTALHSANQSQNITLNGDFGPGAHTVTIDFLNGFAGDPADANRTLYVNAITLDGQTTKENSALMFIGAQTYNVQAGGVVSETAAAISASLNSLNADTQVGQVDVTDSLPVTPTVGQLTSDQRVLGLLHNLNGTALGLDVTDTGQNISAALNALSADSAVGKITVSNNQPITLSAAQLASDAHAIGELTFANGSAALWDLVDTSAHINGLTVKSFASGDEIDLTDLAASGASATFSENSAATSGTLTITSGQHIVSLTLLGQFAPAGASGSALAAGFHLASDGGAGMVISYHG
jgi:hypothetical protein